MTIYHLEELFPVDIEQRLNEVPILVIPIGTIEWHSYHLPLGLDGIVAKGICERIADRLDAVLAPVSYWAAGGEPYPFTLNLPIIEFEALFTTILKQYSEFGFQIIVAFAGHFGVANTLAFKRASLKAMEASKAIILPITEYDLTTAQGYNGDHAAVGETSLLMVIQNNLVRMDSIPADRVLDGIIGQDPRGNASIEKGQQIIDTIVSRSTQVVTRMQDPNFAYQKQSYLDGLQAGVKIFDEIQRQRDLLTKAKAAPLITPSYVRYCQAMADGDYMLALEVGAQKLLDPWS